MLKGAGGDWGFRLKETISVNGSEWTGLKPFFRAVWKRVQLLPDFIGCMCLFPDTSLSCLFKLMLKGSCSATDQIILVFVESVSIQVFQPRVNQKSNSLCAYLQTCSFSFAMKLLCNALASNQQFSFDFLVSERCLLSTLFSRVDRLSS